MKHERSSVPRVRFGTHRQKRPPQKRQATLPLHSAWQAVQQRPRSIQPYPEGCQRTQAPFLPGFLLGFLLVGAANSFGFLPAPLVDVASASSGLLLAASMAGIGLGVDLHVVRRLGLRPLFVGIVGFLVLLMLAGLFVSLVAR